MIQVTTGYPARIYHIDADEAHMLAGSEMDSQTLLVLTKADTEVAWFNGHHWCSAINTASLKDTKDLTMKDDLNDL